MYTVITNWKRVRCIYNLPFFNPFNLVKLYVKTITKQKEKIALFRPFNSAWHAIIIHISANNQKSMPHNNSPHCLTIRKQKLCQTAIVTIMSAVIMSNVKFDVCLPAVTIGTVWTSTGWNCTEMYLEKMGCNSGPTRRNAYVDHTESYWTVKLAMPWVLYVSLFQTWLQEINFNRIWDHLPWSEASLIPDAKDLTPPY